MKRIVFIWLLMAFTGMLKAQQDTVFLIGNSRHYGSSIYLRWNVPTYQQLQLLGKSYIHIWRKTENESAYKEISVLNPLIFPSSPQPESPENKALALFYSLQNKATSSDLFMAMEQQKELNYLWNAIGLQADLNKKVAQSIHLGFEDKTIEKNGNYVYKLYLENKETVSDTLFFNVFFNSHILTKAPKLSVKENEGEIEFSTPTENKYSAYFIQSSKNKKGTFGNVNSIPLANNNTTGNQPEISFHHKVRNYLPMYYRCVAIDLFGDTSLPSEMVLAQARDRTAPPAPALVKVKELNNQLHITWEWPNSTSDAKYFLISTKEQSTDPLRIVGKTIPISNRNYTLPIQKSQTDYYIFVQVFDTAGNSSVGSCFYQTEDNTPPATPRNLRAKVDTNGVVKLQWNRNVEPDLDGYLVFFTNSMNQEPSALVGVPIIDTAFYDTLALNMLNGTVYYFVKAADKRFNQSAATSWIAVKRPDKLPPVSPIITKYTANDSAIFIQFNPSTSTDVKKTILVKKYENKLEKITTTGNGYLDKNIQPGKSYNYTLVAIDTAGNSSAPSNEVNVVVERRLYLEPVVDFKAVYNQTSKSVNLSYAYPTNLKIKKVVIYKGPSLNSVSISPIAISNNKAVDTKIKSGETYYYAIKIVFIHGEETLLSDKIRVDVID